MKDPTASELLAEMEAIIAAAQTDREVGHDDGFRTTEEMADASTALGRPASVDSIRRRLRAVRKTGRLEFRRTFRIGIDGQPHPTTGYRIKPAGEGDE